MLPSSDRLHVTSSSKTKLGQDVPGLTSSNWGCFDGYLVELICSELGQAQHWLILTFVTLREVTCLMLKTAFCENHNFGKNGSVAFGRPLAVNWQQHSGHYFYKHSFSSPPHLSPPSSHSRSALIKELI